MCCLHVPGCYRAESCCLCWLHWEASSIAAWSLPGPLLSEKRNVRVIVLHFFFHSWTVWMCCGRHPLPHRCLGNLGLFWQLLFDWLLPSQRQTVVDIKQIRLRRSNCSGVKHTLLWTPGLPVSSTISFPSRLQVHQAVRAAGSRLLSRTWSIRKSFLFLWVRCLSSEQFSSGGVFLFDSAQHLKGFEESRGHSQNKRCTSRLESETRVIWKAGGDGTAGLIHTENEIREVSRVKGCDQPVGAYSRIT